MGCMYNQQNHKYHILHSEILKKISRYTIIAILILAVCTYVMLITKRFKLSYNIMVIHERDITHPENIYNIVRGNIHQEGKNPHTHAGKLWESRATEQTHCKKKKN